MRLVTVVGVEVEMLIRIFHVAVPVVEVGLHTEHVR